MESIQTGAQHLRFGFIHLFLVLALSFLLAPRQLLLVLGVYALGQSTAILLIEVGIPAPDLLFVDILVLLFAFYVLVVAIKKTPNPQLYPLVSLLGLLHGTAIGKELEVLNLPNDELLIATSVCNLTVDLAQVCLALLLIPLVGALRKHTRFISGLQYLLGSIAVFLILLTFANNVLTGEKHILVEESSEVNDSFTRMASQNRSQASSRPPVAMRMTNPILSYVSIEPFEIRHEVLINAGAAMAILDMPIVSEIPMEMQTEIKNRIRDVLGEGVSLQIEGEMVQPILSSADFVTLGMAGVIVRPDPVLESAQDGIIGISFVYETKTLASDLSLEWGLFPTFLEKVDATTIDPFGGATYVLTAGNPMLKWESSLSGYEVPKVEEVAIESPRVALIPLLMVIAACALFAMKNKLHLKKTWVYLLGAAGIGLYPFVRSPLHVDLIKQWKPSTERSAGIINSLLTNVYRSFDYRKESDVYDRLAISVQGDQLTQTYLEQRKGLEIENRGGAKAKVNDVEVVDVYDVQSGSDNDFGIDAQWKVSGSVSHFGHMHYRQNLYRAIIWITPENGNWKIQNIEMLDEERLM